MKVAQFFENQIGEENEEGDERVEGEEEEQEKERNGKEDRKKEEEYLVLEGRIPGCDLIRNIINGIRIGIDPNNPLFGSHRIKLEVDPMELGIGFLV